ncbi:carboxylate--amine ligase/circularly permuted type 2 ATP-grasp protein [Dietzia cinnamea]|uniref:carboxylate--amine ligase/circularly permuted type 2 ATP-grasp protein n=1 Tax=Dietzia cinnamea TaxID=321318 RepID=UPI0021A7969F|nr:carboxylate--amine ligase/circularly permuted type 2 ATP-grasp protein [Dietzia cinnamea]MCT1711877.1 carboxylate--amine ligase/circularly permuted type 2 ATP-grasp protein [Dietzia cinnamea]MCT2273102.1 carboxylate--amine ligase/circularly permuted type 2 ATP-grasp protein [Dietzia cinnamea]
MSPTGRTIVIEEDLHVLDAATRELTPRAGELIARLPAHHEAVEAESSVVRSCTPEMTSAAGLRGEMRRLRGDLRDAGEKAGLAVVAAGALPLGPPTSSLEDETVRFRRLLADYEFLVRDQVYCSTGVRVGVTDRDRAVQVACRTSAHLPAFLALTASSPFLRDGSDSGHASYRSTAASRWPTIAPVAGVCSAEEYDALVDGLVASGVVSDASMVRFGVQPGRDGRTVELTACDSSPIADTAVLVAVLFRALVERESAALDRGAQVGSPADVSLRAAMWRAARSGLEGDLVDPGTARPGPAADVLTDLVTSLADELSAAGDLDLVRELLDDALYNGSSAYRQRQVLRRRTRPVDVVDLLVAETSGSTGTRSPMSATRGRLFGGYVPLDALDPDPSWDEAFGADGEPRPEYERVIERLERVGTVRLRARQIRAEQEAAVAGVTFRVTGEDRPHVFPMDFLPRIVTSEVWERLAAGVEQRARALDAFLNDVYGDQAIVAAGRLAPEALDRAPGYRSTGRVMRPGRIRAHISGVDLVCADDGRWLVLEDNVRVPSGIAFSHAHREMTTTLFGDLMEGYDLYSPDEAFPMIRRTLEATAPPAAGDDPAVVMLSSGPTDSAWFEHRLIAERAGLPLVTPDAVAFVDGVLHRRDRGGLHRIDVVYARIDEDMLLSSPGFDGVPLRDGLLEALFAGRLTVANALGNGVADDKAIYAAVPEMIDFYLGESPILDQVPTFLCADRTQRDHVLDRLAEMVVKPIDGYGGAGITIGPECTEAELAERREDLLARPERYIAQDVVSLSTLPTFDGREMQRRHVDLRAFAHLRREGGRTTAHAVPAALTRVAPAGSMIVNSSRGGGGKDTWILRLPARAEGDPR